MTLLTPGLERRDFFRFGGLGQESPVPRKEWHHFIVHGHGARVIVNFSLSDHQVGSSDVPVPRVIVLTHHREWGGWIDEVEPTDVGFAPDRLAASFGENRVAFEEGGYNIELDMPGSGVQGWLRFVPTSESFLMNNLILGSSGRLSWLIVPRLRVDGQLKAGGVEFSMRGAEGYHDHNWGRFRWGDGFGWDWGSMLPASTSERLSAVLWRVTDRGHTKVVTQGLALWRDGRPLVTFRDADLKVEVEGFLREGPRVTVPSTMALLSSGTAADVPRRMLMMGRRGHDHVVAEFAPSEFGRIAIPSEVPDRKAVALHEISGEISVRGVVSGEEIELGGTGVFETLR